MGADMSAAEAAVRAHLDRVHASIERWEAEHGRPWRPPAYEPPRPEPASDAEAAVRAHLDRARARAGRPEARRDEPEAGL
jgi:hypothetical protein